MELNRRRVTPIDSLRDPMETAQVVPMGVRPRAIGAEVVTVDLGDVIISMGEHSWPVTTSGGTLADRIGILVALRPTSSAHANGEVVGLGVAYALGGAAAAVGTTGQAADFATMSFTREALECSAMVLGLEIELPASGECRPVQIATPARLRHLLLNVSRPMRDTSKPASSPREVGAFAEAMLEIAVRSLGPHGEDRALTPQGRLTSMRIVKACEDYATASRYQGLTLAELSGASGVSERRVRYAFYDCHKMSPIAYLRIAALNAVRAQLLEGPVMADAVTRAASDFGFWHLGRFAGQYRVLFGELPSETIAHRSNLAVG